MATAPGPTSTFDIGRVIERTVTTITGNFGVFILLAAVLAGLPAAVFSTGMVEIFLHSGLSSLGSAPGQPLSQDIFHVLTNALPALGALGLIAWLVSLVANYVLQAAIVHGAITSLNGRRASFGECISTGLRHWFWLLLLAIVTGVALFFGFILLIFPGLMMLTAWVVAVPAQVVERTGVFGALGRSADLTRGRRWPIFGLLVVYAIAAYIFQIVLQSLTNVAVVGFLHGLSPTLAPLVGGLIISPVNRTITSLVGAAGVASIYYELRSAREGIGPEALAAVFD
ncbi:MAG TPA: hypothetical protein VHZ26_10185 [Caulobacteraceae bacterium]|jgi:hypothetical protein|nr:hypothetical protein [Caulobacteraceae bacterium]